MLLTIGKSFTESAKKEQLKQAKDYDGGGKEPGKENRFSIAFWHLSKFF
jgi:hypothetical protein